MKAWRKRSTGLATDYGIVGLPGRFSQGHTLVAMIARVDRIKERLSVLVGAGYMTHRLTNLALSEVDGSWADLSAADISHLAAWVQERHSATNGRLRFEWTHILAAFTSVRQVRNPSSVQAADVLPSGSSEIVDLPDDPRPPPTDRDDPAKWKEELPLLSAVPSPKSASARVDQPTIARQGREARGKRSATKGAAHKRPK